MTTIDSEIARAAEEFLTALMDVPSVDRWMYRCGADAKPHPQYDRLTAADKALCKALGLRDWEGVDE